MEAKQSQWTKASLAGHDGYIVGADDSGLQWEVELRPQQLGALIARCGGGGPLAIVTSSGRLQVRARRWWVWPADDTVRVRLALEDSSA